MRALILILFIAGTIGLFLLIAIGFWDFYILRLTRFLMLVRTLLRCLLLLRS